MADTKASVIVTVLNEGESIRTLMDSLAAQARPPDEIVVVDGGSSDDTVAQVRAYSDRLPLRIFVEPGANISQGRNRAIAEARNPIIASTDAGVRLHPRWLECLLEPFAGPEPPQVVAGFFLPDPHTVFEIAMGATVLPRVEDVNPRSFLPSSRSVAFTKEAWEKVGGYPEWLDFCEDLIFDFRLRECAGEFGWAPEAIAYFRPRPNLRAFALQYYRYARGDGKADLWRLRHAIRYGTYLLALPAILLAAAFVTPWALLLLLFGCAAYCRTPYRRLLPEISGLSLWEKAYALALVPVIRVVGDVAKMVGYPVGLWWRWRNRSRSEVHWRNRGC